MKTVVTEKGQIAIPTAIRDSLGIRAGITLGVQEFEGGILLRKRKERDSIGQRLGKGRLPVGKAVEEYLNVIRG